MFIEQLLGSKSKIKILRVLSEARVAYTPESLRKETHLSAGIISESLQELVLGSLVVRIKGEKKQRLYKINTSSPYAPFIFAIFGEEKIKQRKNTVFLPIWNLLHLLVDKLKTKVEFIMLFGSHARGEATLYSDIDILLIPKEGISSEQLTTIVHDLSKKIEPLILETKLFESYISIHHPLLASFKREAILLYVSSTLKKEIRQWIKNSKINV